MSKVTIRIDDKLKKDAEELFNELGMNMTTAFTVFIKKAVREQRIPFEISADYPNLATRLAMEETERILRDPNRKTYSTAEEMMGDILKDEIQD
ncbi:MAG: addiction module antitoxin, RelB/DinJ family [Anaerocolumna sp.]|jgi:DNA-damage-inducible protein J|nr:addiction module antitoxin, RelB/DinJ family [Anaerocolumna sp.]